MSYSHLTKTDRIKIETYLELGLKSCQIASKLGVHKSTISRELSRLPNVLKRSEIVRPLVTGSSILWCLTEAKVRAV